MVLAAQHIAVPSTGLSFPSWVGPGLILRQTGVPVTYRLTDHAATRPAC
ncbi:hypothetical protein [Micromonospora echinofusca]